MSLIKHLFWAAVVSVATLPQAPAQESDHWSRRPSTFLSIDAKIEQDAVGLKDVGEVQRMAYYDLAAPADGAELAELGGYGVVLVTALSHDSTELPPARVYVDLGGREIPLTLVAAPPTRTQLSVRARRVLGEHRWQGLYLFPMFAMQDGASLKMDFATRRRGFSLGALSSAAQDELGYGRRLSSEPVVEMPAEEPLVGLINREFPGALAD